MLEILQYPDPRLKQVSRAVTDFDEKLHSLLDEMAQSMYSAKGIGLAAPQVGQLVRVFLIDLGPQESDSTGKLYELINPNILGGEGEVAFEEGCLSLPGVTAEVHRKNRITVAYQDRQGAPRTLKADQLLAVAIQHENDHLDGILLIDRISPLKRRLLKKKLQKVVTL